MKTEKKLFYTEKNEYEEVELLKKGERGSVFVVRKKEDGKRFLLRKTEENPEIYKKLLGISSPNLPKIFEVYEEKDANIIIEEYIFGDTLFDILKNGVLSVKEAAESASQICRALSDLHEHGIVHRDIKPENVILSGEKTVLIDFDASRKNDPEKTNDTQILGTTGYAAPEQYGLSQTDARSDIYSLGVVLNLMLTGEHPSTRLASGKLGEIVQKCTMINPDMRFQSAAELKKTLDESVKPKTGRIAKILLGIAATLVFVSVFTGVFMSTEGNIPAPEFDEEENAAEEIQPEENQVQKDPDNLIIERVFTAKGKSSLLPEDFYDYWDKDEIITEGIEIYFPGKLEDYISYEFSDDVWTFTVGNIPAEEWKRAFEENLEESSEIFARIFIDTPSEKITGVFNQMGNGYVYGNLKEQYENGVEFNFDPFVPGKDLNITSYIFANVLETEEGFFAAPIERNSIFYSVFLWENNDGTFTWKILPYQFVLSEDCKAAFFESEKKVYSYAETDFENLWMDRFWEPVTDSKRIVFRTINNGVKNCGSEYLREKGLEIEIFEKPGFVYAFADKEKMEVPEEVAVTDFFVLPPDAPEKAENESFEDWIKRAFAETKYVGFREGSANVLSGFNEAETREQWEIINSSPFFKISENKALAMIWNMEQAETEDGKVWYSVGNEKPSAMLLNWYIEDPTENPEAEPALCEYVYYNYEKTLIFK